jgi:hypothetical protein
MLSQVPFLRFAAEMYLGHPFFCAGDASQKQMQVARYYIGWERDVVPTLAAQGWGTHFFVLGMLRKSKCRPLGMT